MSHPRLNSQGRSMDSDLTDSDLTDSDLTDSDLAGETTRRARFAGSGVEIQEKANFVYRKDRGASKLR